jgi:hypothetical protein
MSISAVNGTDSLYTDYLSMLQQANSGGASSGTTVSGSQHEQHIQQHGFADFPSRPACKPRLFNNRIGNRKLY